MKTAPLKLSIFFFFFLSFLGIPIIFSQQLKAQTCSGSGSTTYSTYVCNRTTTGGYQCARSGSTVSNSGSCEYRNGGCYFRETNEPHCTATATGCDMSNQCGGSNVCYAPCGTSGGGGGGGGGTCSTCPAGQSPRSYNPPRYFCPNPGACTTINRIVLPEQVCGTTINGNDKVRYEERYCAPNATPTPSNRNPIGSFDGADCNTLWGWAYDPDSPSTSINVHLYDGTTFIGSYPTNQLRSGVNSAYGITGNHGYSISTPNAFKNGAAHSIRVYAINAQGGTNPQLSNSPKSLTCGSSATATPTRRPTNTPTRGPTATPAAVCSAGSANLTGSGTLAVGTTRTISMTVSDSPGGCTQNVIFSTSNTNVSITTTNPDTAEPFTAIVRCNSAGTTTVTGRARNGTTILASDTISITCTQTTPTPTPRNTPTPTRATAPTPTPGLGQCSAPAPRDPPATSCGNPGSVTWSWNDVNRGNEYNLVIEQFSGGSWNVVQDYGWQAASTFGSGCNGDGTGTCSRVNSRPPGTYRSRIRARNNSGICSTSTFSTSSQVTITSCTATPTPTRTTTSSCLVGSAVFSASSANLTVGATRTFSLTANDNPSGCTQDTSFTRSNTNISITTTNPDTTEPFTVTVRCDVAGSATLTGRARNGGVSLASDTVNINCGAAATPTPTRIPSPTPTPVPLCTAPRPKDPPTVTCGNPGTIEWEWNDVSRANQYNLVIQRLVSGVWTTVNDYGWLSAGSFGADCDGDGVGVCTRTETRSGGPFRSQIRSRNTNALLCTTSGFSNSSQVSVFGCTTIDVPDIEINGAPASQNAIVSTTNMPAGGTISFNVDDTSIATVAPPSDSSPAYQTTVTSQSIGETEYTASTVDSYGNPVSGTGTITVLNPRPWCQGVNGDILARGAIQCTIPPSCTSPSCDPYLIVSASARRSGLVAAGRSVENGSGQSSLSNYTITNEPYGGQDYNYSYLNNKASGINFQNVGGSISGASGLTAGSQTNGYYWSKSGGDLSIGNIDLGGNRVVLFVDGNLTINGNIKLTDGVGFFMAVVRGGITVDASVKDAGAFESTPDSEPELEGIYYSQGSFVSQSAGDGQDQQLHVRGSVAAGSFELQRDLPDNSLIPSEVFEFGPDQVLRLPAILSRKQVIWREVAP